MINCHKATFDRDNEIKGLKLLHGRYHIKHRMTTIKVLHAGEARAAWKVGNKPQQMLAVATML